MFKKRARPQTAARERERDAEPEEQSPAAVEADEEGLECVACSPVLRCCSPTYQSERVT